MTEPHAHQERYSTVFGTGRYSARQDKDRTPSDRTFNLLLIDDHKLLREGLKVMLNQDPSLRVVGDERNCSNAAQLYSKLQPDLVLIDPAETPFNSNNTIRDIINVDPEAKVLVLTSHAADEHVFKALKSGARGYLLKDADWEETLRAILTVLSGHCYLSPMVSSKIVRGFLRGRENLQSYAVVDKLTPREKEILQLIAQRLTNRKIAEQLFISIKTVEKHRSNIMRKLNLHSATELIAFAESSGLTRS